MHRSPSKPVLLAATIGGLAVAGIASAAAASVPKAGAGDGSAAVLEYALSGTPVYTLNPTNPQQLDHVTFSLTPAPPATAEVRAQVLNPGGAWYVCSFSGPSVTCLTTAAGVPASSLTANQLRVVVVD